MYSNPTLALKVLTELIDEIRKEDLKGRDPFWKEKSFKRVHKNKKKYNRKDKHKTDEKDN